MSSRRKEGKKKKRRKGKKKTRGRKPREEKGRNERERYSRGKRETYRHKSHISRDSITSLKGYNVAGDQLISHKTDNVSVTFDMTKMRNELVEGFERFFGSILLNKGD